MMIEVNIDSLIIAIANRSITMNKLSKRAGISRTTLYRFINGKNKPTLVVIGKVAKALDIPVETLIKI